MNDFIEFLLECVCFVILVVTLTVSIVSPLSWYDCKSYAGIVELEYRTTGVLNTCLVYDDGRWMTIEVHQGQRNEVTIK